MQDGRIEMFESASSSKGVQIAAEELYRVFEQTDTSPHESTFHKPRFCGRNFVHDINH